MKKLVFVLLVFISVFVFAEEYICASSGSYTNSQGQQICNYSCPGGQYKITSTNECPVRLKLWCWNVGFSDRQKCQVKI